MNNLPLRYLSKMNTYNNISINGVDVKATVLDGGSDELINSCITKIRRSLERDVPVVGIEIIKNRLGLVKSLLIFAENRCLIILLERMPSLPSAVSSFLTDDSICFVGFQIGKLLYRLVDKTSKSNSDGYPWLMSNTSETDWSAGRLIGKKCRDIISPTENEKVCLRTVPIGEFAARVVKDSTLQNCSSLVELAGKPEIDVKHVPCQNKEVDWEAVCFSQEEIKSVMQDVYLCYKIAMRALSTL